MNSVIFSESHTAVQELLKLAQAKFPIIDVTYGNGTFWKEAPYSIYGFDRQPERALSGIANFMHLPFATNGIPTVIFDPPFHPKGANSAEASRFKTMGQDEKDLKLEFQKGIAECWRITKGHLLVKCQGFIHNHLPQWMPLWAIQVCGEPFEWLVVARNHKRISGMWKQSLSLRRNHADYLIFSKTGNKR